MNMIEIHNLVALHELSSLQDWRLDPDEAIEGGALYLNYLINYWNNDDNSDLLKQNRNIEFVKVVLASYNSGPARIKSKIKTDGEKWLDDDELKEAYKYVNSVVSYCYHFSESE